jgi:hypothetical protein
MVVTLRPRFGGSSALPIASAVQVSGFPCIAAGTSTENGLEVRRPAAVGAAAGPSAGRPVSTGATATLPQAGTGPQPVGPALVAVPAPSAASAPQPAPAPGRDGAPEADPEAPGTQPPARHDDVPADGARPATTQPEDQPPVSDTSTTPSGLPVRVPQANLAEPLRADEPVVADEPEEQDDPGRSPAEIKRIMGSYQRGARRGRSDAARSDPSPAPVPPARAPGADGAPEADPEAPGTEPPARHAGVPADGERPATTQPEDQPAVPDISTTPSGLPVRVPQANLAEPLRADEPVVADEPEEQEDPGRSPAEIKRIMGSYQRGTRRGRSDAARSDPSPAAEDGAAEGPAQEGGTDPGNNAAEGEKDQ